jgi:hypothetical protein
MMMPSYLKWILALALLVSVLPAEGSRRHSFEAPASVRTAPQRDEEPRRGLFGAFGRDDDAEQQQKVRRAGRPFAVDSPLLALCEARPAGC